jgi:hypothetical protein
VVGPLARLRQGTDGRQPAADQPEVERGDREAAGEARERLAPARQHAFQRERPAERQRQVDRDGGRQQLERPALARQQQRAGRPRALEDVVAADERDRRRRPAAEDGSGEAGDDRILDPAQVAAARVG